MTSRAQTPTPDNATTPATPATPPLLMDARGPSQLCAVGLISWHGLISQDRVPPSVCLGRCVPRGRANRAEDATGKEASDGR